MHGARAVIGVLCVVLAGCAGPLPPDAAQPGRSEYQPAISAPPRWQRYAAPAPASDGRPSVTIVIDDMGLNRRQSAHAAALPGPVTLSWLPYAQDLPQQVAEARRQGHEALVHMPMQPVGRQDPGPHALRPDLPAWINAARLADAIAAVPEAIGLNNHEGSRATQDGPLMDLMAAMLHQDGMLFLDSRTIGSSIALNRARAAGVPSAARDVFLDDNPDPASIRAQLALTEAVARRKGYAVAIGHPRPATLAALKAWLPGLDAKGLVLVPLSAAIAAQAETP